MNEHINDFSWYTIVTDDTHAYLYFHNKKGVQRLEGKRLIADINELWEKKHRLEERKERINKIVSEAFQKAMKLAQDNPEEFKRIFNKGE